MLELLPGFIFFAGVYLWVPRVVAFYGRTYFDDPAARPGRPARLAVALPLGLVLRCAHLPPEKAPFLALVLVALAGVVLCDLKFQVIPDRFQLVGAAGALGLAQGPVQVGLGLALVAALWALTALYTRVRKRDALGLGDIKLLAWLSLAFGPDTLFVLVYGLGLAFFAVVPFVVLRRKSLSSFFAFGPFLAAAAVLRLAELTFLA